MVDGNNKVTWLVNYTTLLNQRVTAELVAPSLGYTFIAFLTASLHGLHQTCKTKTTAFKTKTNFLVSDRSCPKTNGSDVLLKYKKKATKIIPEISHLPYRERLKNHVSCQRYISDKSEEIR